LLSNVGKDLNSGRLIQECVVCCGPTV